MRILGISNPSFQGVTIATQAIVTAHYGIGHLDNYGVAMTAAANILAYKPDVLIVGGWSAGYEMILEELVFRRDFPVICIYHGTLSHTMDGDYLQKILNAHAKKHVNILSFVHAPTNQYFQEVKGMKNSCVWLPHYFPMQKRVQKSEKFRIGIFGGSKSWFKNCNVAIQVANDYAKEMPNVEVVHNENYSKPHNVFLKELENFQLLIHPSHLECYSNMVQEAWARGIPVILSKANRGLYKSPLTTKANEYKDMDMDRMLIEDNIDPSEIYRAIQFAHSNWSGVSTDVHQMYQVITNRANKYTNEMLKFIAEKYKEGAVRSAHFEYRKIHTGEAFED